MLMKGVSTAAGRDGGKSLSMGAKGLKKSSSNNREKGESSIRDRGLSNSVCVGRRRATAVDDGKIG